MSAKPLQGPPTLTDLTLRFVNRPIDAALIEAENGAIGEVEPHEVAVGFRTDARAAWNEGLAAVAGLAARKEIQPPTDWAGAVARHEAVASQPFALAGYPQRVRDLTVLVQTIELTQLLPSGDTRPASTTVGTWVKKLTGQKEPLTSLLGVAVLRAAEDLDQATELLEEIRGAVPESMRTAFGNEEAALLWQKGQANRAAALWNSLPETPAVLFNRGMAALFLGDAAGARKNLKKAIELIPEKDGWHHLASLYLALAEMRGA